MEFFFRLLMAAIISFTGVVATYMWSKSQRVKVLAREAKPVARIVTLANEVQKRPENRLIWQHVSPRQELFAGEGVRTASDAEATIEFIDKQVTVRLDPDSVIEIEESEAGLNLDFLKGNIFIVSKDEEAEFTVQSGDQKVAVGNSELQVSKTSPAAPMDVDVMKGQAKVTGQTKAKPERRLKLIHPRPGEPLYVKPDSNDAISFEWQPVESNYDIVLELGPSKSALKRVDLPQPVKGSAGRLAYPVKVGKHSYRLIAKSERGELLEIFSPVARLEVRAKVPPVLLQPVAGAVLKPAPTPDFEFSWTNPGALEDLVLELARSKTFKDIIVFKTAGAALTETVSLADEGGLIFWRVSGRLPGSQIAVSSATQSFFLQAKGREPLKAPALKTPEQGHSYPLLTMQNQGAVLSWESATGATAYEIRWSSEQPNETPAKQVTKATEWKITDIKPGTYKWAVVARDDYGQESPPSETRSFEVESLATLAWADGLTSAKFVYKTEKPFFRVAWERGPGNPSLWRARVTASREPAAQGEWKLLQTPELEAQLEEPGTYSVEVESVDASGAVLARTLTRLQEVVQSEPPAPPEFADSMPATLQARDNGSVDLAWKPAADANEYVLQMKNASGNIIKTQRLKGTQTTWTKLRTGDYTVTLQSVDGIGRAGPESAARPLQVPEYSEVQAPKLRSVKVK